MLSLILAILCASSCAEQERDIFGNGDTVSFGPSPNIIGLVGGRKGAAAVIVVQEWWGLTEQVKEHARMIADEGYRVLIPDLYRGEIGVDKEEAQHLMKNLDLQIAIAEIGYAAEFLKSSEEGSPSVGIIGFGMGGALSLGALAASKHIICAATFYGLNFDLFDAKKQLQKKPISAHFGRLDTMEGFSDPSTAMKLQQVLQDAGNTDSDVYVYEGVGHAFMNTNPEPYSSFETRFKEIGIHAYKKDQAELAWHRVLNFFRIHLHVTYFQTHDAEL